MKLKCIRDCAVIVHAKRKKSGNVANAGAVESTETIGFKKGEIVSKKDLIDLLKDDKNFVKTASQG